MTNESIIVNTTISDHLATNEPGSIIYIYGIVGGYSGFSARCDNRELLKCISPRQQAQELLTHVLWLVLVNGGLMLFEYWMSS